LLPGLLRLGHRLAMQLPVGQRPVLLARGRGVGHGTGGHRRGPPVCADIDAVPGRGVGLLLQRVLDHRQFGGEAADDASGLADHHGQHFGRARVLAPGAGKRRGGRLMPAFVAAG